MVEGKTQKIIIKSLAYISLAIAALICILPFVLVVSASFSTEFELTKYGYSFFPRGFTLEAYKVVMSNPEQLINTYITTIFVTVVGTVFGVLLTAMTAYPLSRKDFKGRRAANLYLYFTMLFSGGAIPSYILIAQYLHMKNNILVLIVPLLLNVWNVFMLRTYFSSVSISLVEAAKMDGASEFKTFFRVVIPVSRVGVVTIALLIAVAYWNDWYQSFMFMTRGKNITLQYYLYSIMSNVESMIRQSMKGIGNIDISKLPSETARMAICVLASGPMVFIFMFCQKYFEKGIAVGSVKG